MKSKEFKLLGPKFEEEQIEKLAEPLNLERNILKQFLIDMKENKIIKSNNITGIYEFTSALLYLYLTHYYILTTDDKV